MQKLILIWLLFLSLILEAQPFSRNFITFTRKNGLTDEMVTCLHRDAEGFLWVGTENGVSRFDGSVFQPMTGGASKTVNLDKEFILDFYEEGPYIWIAHRDGVTRIHKFSLRTEIFPIDDTLPNQYVLKNIRDIQEENGNLWFAGYNLYRYNPTKNRIDKILDIQKFTQLGSERYINKIIYDKERSIFYLFTESGWVSYNSKTNKLDPTIINSLPLHLFRNQNLRMMSLWNTYMSGWQISYDSRSQNIRFENDNANGVYVNAVRNLFVDEHLNIYCNTEADKTVKWNTTTGEIEKNFLSPTNSFGLNSYNFHWLYFPDSSNQLWRTYKGLSFYDHRNQFYKHYPFREKVLKYNFTETRIRDVALFSNNNWMIATYGGLFLMNRETQEVEPFSRWKDSMIYRVFIATDKTAWLSTASKLYHFRVGDNKILFSCPLNSYAMFIYEEKSGEVVAGTRSSGLVIIHPDKKIEQIANATEAGDEIIPSNKTTSWFKSPFSGKTYYTYNYKGLFSENDFASRKFDKRIIPATSHVPFSQYPLLGLNEDDSFLWVGSYHGGIFRCDKRTGAWENFNLQSGLSDNTIYTILEDRRRRVWLGTHSGVNLLDLPSKRIYKLPLFIGLPVSKDVGFTLPNGNFVFYDYDQIFEIRPEEFELQFPKASLRLTQLVCNEDTLWLDKNNFSLKHFQNNLLINYSLFKSNPEQSTKYSYRIREIENEWKDNGSSTQLNLVGLSAGNYSLQIRATDEFGQWSYFSDVIKFKIKPAFWNTWVFYLLVTLFIGVLLYSFYKYRIRQLKKLHALRTKISQDLHDEVGATLSGIALYSHLTQQQIQNQQTEKVQESLSAIQNTSTQMVNRLNDIVWAVNPQHDSVADVLQHLEEYAVEMAAAKNMQVKMYIEPRITHLTLSMAHRKNIYLICKEAINNSVKYSNASLIELKAMQSDHQLDFYILDNGKGFTKEQIRHGNGITNMEARAKEINARLLIESMPGRGTGIQLNCKIT